MFVKRKEYNHHYHLLHFKFYNSLKEKKNKFHDYLVIIQE